MTAGSTTPAPLLTLACSPRPGGNSDTAAGLFAAAFAPACEQNGLFLPPPQVVRLREHAVLPCIGCDACRKAAERCPDKRISRRELAEGEKPSRPPFGCPLSLRDESAAILTALLTAPALCLAAPIYFYHLPAHLKGLLDRLQSFWSFHEAGVTGWAPPHPRPCFTLLLGAREKGEKLFDGSLLTLQYALKPLGLHLEPPLLLYGLEARGDLAAQEKTQQRVRDYGQNAGRITAQRMQT